MLKHPKEHSAGREKIAGSEGGSSGIWVDISRRLPMQSWLCKTHFYDLLK
jgi:hypothetical protein